MNTAVTNLVAAGSFMDWTNAQIQPLTAAYQALDEACRPLGATFSTATTSAGAEDVALADLCVKHCEALKTVQNLGPCNNESTCDDQVAQIQSALDAVEVDAASAGLLLDQMPAFSKTMQDLKGDLSAYSSEQPCAGVQPNGGGQALICGTTVLTMKTQLGILALTLERFKP